ncbi:Degenerin-like protein asic-1 [Penaeus vannamei]|uniref:Degenerin-like protein asic-1 n=1 Tax=Penaeus vannamei TaxID=6689 RepID=A0A3R7M1F8_PENVA|nr:Degenerin-like protein asic-1 [Penaeus vannamei]
MLSPQTRNNAIPPRTYIATPQHAAYPYLPAAHLRALTIKHARGLLRLRAAAECPGGRAETINLQHKSRVNFPAVTVCNQNRISCWKLQERMLKQLSVSVEGEDSTRLVELYNFTRCGVDGIGCSKVHEIYHRFFSREKGSIPENLANKDVCLHCSTILAEYINMCYVENLQKPTQALTYIWRERDCYSQMKNQNLEFGDQIIQESLDNCFGVPFKTNNSATPSTAETSSKVDPLAVDSQTSTNLDAPGLRVKRQNSRIATKLIKTISRDEMSPSEDHDLKMNFLVEYMDLNHQLKKDIGYDFRELIKDCTFMGLKCMDESHFVYSHSPSYGNCYIFNERGNYTTSLTGPTFSLSLVIDAKENTYLPKMLTEKVGARVAVHKPKTQPLMSEEAMDVPPGMSSSIALKEVRGGHSGRRTTLKRLAYPFDANCTSGWNNTEYRYNKDTVYTLTECLNMCLQRLFVDDCGCYWRIIRTSSFFSEITVFPESHLQSH